MPLACLLIMLMLLIDTTSDFVYSTHTVAFIEMNGFMVPPSQKTPIATERKLMSR